MLHDLDRLGKDFQKRFNEIKIWPEVKFSETDRVELNKLKIFSQINDSTIQINTSEHLHCIIPSQYILYAVLIKEFALALRDYTDIIDSLKEGNQIADWDLINNADTTIPKLSALDQYSRDHVYTPFKREACILGAKDILNLKNGKEKKVRASKDFFGSVVLKVINVPDVSSSEVGKLIYDLTSEKNRNVYDYLEKKYLAELPFISFNSSMGEFVRSVLSFLDQYDGLSKLIPLIKSNAKIGLESIEFVDEKLTSIFYVKTTLATIQDISSGGSKRFLEEPLFILDNKYTYLSTQWTNKNEEGRLDINVFKRIIESNYPEFTIELNGTYIFKCKNDMSISSLISNGINVIYYGAPGTGKSYSVDNATEESRSVRTVFHADTQFSDFIGCLKPIVDPSGVTYSFRAGPFTLALVNALKDPQNHYWLIVEEINRAPAAAVFGEIFQLLDRGVNGKSKYSITPSDPDMIAYIETALNTKLYNGSIYIPSNLSILATMNSSDQAVMPLDTAFKRRWRFKYIPLNFTFCAVGTLSFLVPVRGKIEISWSLFARTINGILSDLEIPEDRHLGPFFLDENELKDSDSQQESLTGKLFMYLWDDVLRHGYRPELFRADIKTYGQLTSLHANDERVFSERFYAALEIELPSISVVENMAEDESAQ